MLQTLSYHDVANAADYLTCPVLISAGINDPYSRPTGIYAAYNRLAGPRAIKLYLADHKGGEATHWEEKIKWLTQVLGGHSPQPAGADAVGGGSHDGGATAP